MKVQFGPGTLELAQGNLVTQNVDAIVNAANSHLAVGGGVCGAIHRAAGPAVEEEIEQKYPDGCPTGNAVATGGGELAARWIFHAVGPVWQGGHAGEGTLLRSAHRRCLELAVEHQCQSIAFPAISTGIYGFPIDLAAEHSLDEVRKFLVETKAALRVRFVLLDAGSYAAFARVLESMVE
ncbi:MAG TPA: macro domain-containing protein [Planctomycetaceae bacterium]|nr:macro domain-containing protein [Planctomycetaceae bacterium]